MIIGSGFGSTLAGALLISIVNLALRPWRRRSGAADQPPRLRVITWR
jgi:hypothetical protein